MMLDRGDPRRRGKPPGWKNAKRAAQWTATPTAEPLQRASLLLRLDWVGPVGS
jgi:hypothetical protein